MGIKSKAGQSAVKIGVGIPKDPNSGIKVISGKAIVNKPINRHHANPGYKAPSM